MWVEYQLTAGSAGVATSIQVTHSTNGGQMFGASVNALETSTSTAAWHAQIVLESSGHLDVEYYGGTGEGDPSAAVYYVQSADQGGSWSKATLIKKPVKLNSAGISDGWLGDYFGVTTADGSLFTTFTDNSSGTSHVDFAKETLP